jgi:hypothetical protein
MFQCICACCAARCRLGRWCHRLFPGPIREPATSPQGKIPDGMGMRASAPSATVAAPPSLELNPLDRWLCVPIFRWVCPCHLMALSVKASPMTVKRLYCVQPLIEQCSASICRIVGPLRRCSSLMAHRESAAIQA